MKHSSRITIIGLSVAMMTIAVGAAIALSKNQNSFVRATDNVYWNHYARVEPTETVHGSKEFWANCSTHNFSLSAPGGGVDVREGVAFNTTEYFNSLSKSDPRYIPALNEETVDIKGYFLSLLETLNHDPYSYIPDTMRPEEVTHYTESALTYDFTNFTNVSDIKYGGFGEQWHMVIENIQESQRFYNVTTYGTEILTASRTLVSAFLDEYYGDTVSKTFNDGESRFYSKIFFDGTTLTYNIQFLSGITIPFFGTLTPQIDMEYVIASNIKSARIQLSENNALKFVITPDTYTFGLEYGVETVSRKAYFTISKDEHDAVEGHIYEFVQFKDKDLVPACADFYIDEDYVSAVGNKASAITGFDGYINELYETDEGKLLGYKVREEFTKWGVSKRYNTLWFNLNDILNINNVKAISNGSVDPHENNHDIYLNNSASVFEPAKNKVAMVSTSRKYDVEMRKQYFYNIVSEELEEYERLIPMMFIQDDGDKSGETNYSTFETDILDKNGIAASVLLSNTYLTKIRADYLSLIDIFIANSDDVDADYIVDFIGDATVIG